MSALAIKAREAVNDAIYAVVDSAESAKEIARAVDITERNVRALKYREHEPSAETQIKFGFAYPSVGEVWAYWSRRMTEPTLFDLDEQAAFHRDYSRSGRRT